MFHVEQSLLSLHAFDVVVIGGGHAGCEAACAAIRRGARVALITFSQQNIGQMSCNPSIGGVGKGHLVRELDVFDGLMAKAADAATIHRRMLNRSKGTAVHGPRVQADRATYQQSIRAAVELSGVLVIEDEVLNLSIHCGKIVGVELGSSRVLACATVVVATGTFLGGRIFRGESIEAGGRIAEAPSTALATQFAGLGLSTNRLKTGTPPRLDGRTIDWALLERQPSDSDRWSMSALPAAVDLPKVDCALTRTTPRTHEIISDNFARSPLFAGAIEGRGPRYCPSIEDKVKRFADRDGHQVFLEPEGLGSHLVYPNGLSTSLPADIQADFIASIPGLERAKIVTPGYAVEYSHLDPRLLDARLAHRHIDGLFLAGQINGTTGYEEAAAQGLVAGLNAAALALSLAPVTFARSTSYIGVMIDDLILHGVTEPYRMMTARAEFRLHLRSDNATTRLGDDAIQAGCISEPRRRLIKNHGAAYQDAAATLRRSVSQKDLIGGGGSERKPLREWLLQLAMKAAVCQMLKLDAAMTEAVTDAEYAPYLERHRLEWAKMSDDRSINIAPDFRFDDVPGLSTEMIERMSAAQPSDMAQLTRIRGITPAALTAVHFALVRRAA